MCESRSAVVLATALQMAFQLYPSCMGRQRSVLVDVFKLPRNEKDGLMTHTLQYRAGSQGFVGIPDSEPLWFCSCREWSMPARPMSHRKSGNNQIEAERSQSRHALAADLVANDLVATYAEALERLDGMGVAGG